MYRPYRLINLASKLTIKKKKKKKSFAQDWLYVIVPLRSIESESCGRRRPLLAAAAPPAVGWEVISS